MSHLSFIHGSFLCAHNEKHAVCVFTSPTLSRLSSLSSREVVYIGS